MKTTSYNAEKEIKIGILVVIFTISIFTAVRVKELQLSDATNADETRSSQILINNASIPSIPILDARLIEESVPEVKSLMKVNEYKANEFAQAEMALESERFLNGNNEAVEVELALRIESLMNVNEYKADEFVQAEMALESERFLNSNNETVEAEFVLQIESWMKANEYKATEFVESEMALEIQSLDDD